MNNIIERILNDEVVGQCKLLSRHWPRVTERNHEKPQ